MASPTLSLLGVVANSCDDGATDFGVNTNTEIFVEGTGSAGSKVSATTATFSTTTLTGAPYDFTSGGSNEGDHIILWMDALNAANGFGIYAEEGSDNGRWDVPLPAGYTGGFIPIIANPAADFDAVGGSWSASGNPTQLDNVTGLGGYFDIAGSIMGNFDNALMDQITVGQGIRIEDGDGTTPGTWSAVRNYDEGTNVYGWVRLIAGTYAVQGKIRVGPASGNNDCTWVDSGKKVTFLAVPVAVGFHEISVEEPGTGTTSWTQSGMFIAAQDSSVARWSFTAPESATIDESDGTWEGFGSLTLNSNSTFDNVTFVDGETILQNGATFDGCTVRDAATADGVALIASDDPSLISDCSFTFSDGHAIEITTPGTYSFVGNTFTDYLGTPGSNDTPSSGSTDAAIYNNSGGAVTLNISGGGSTPSVRNGASATTTIASTVTVTVTPLATGSEVRAYLTGTSTEVDGTETSTGSSHALSLSSGVAVDIVVINPGPPTAYEPARFQNVSFSSNQDFNPVQRIDRNFSNPS